MAETSREVPARIRTHTAAHTAAAATTSLALES
eukprot:CAMPEP_0175060754 /NCGR_PEP_ID=MMETSP0052_2-20121109/13205_1 /TAXON_ID=51329 ORGANISM="Polytomella parva, Strain SAG 63-3" /NCGR_SAMPLE_ID=MMETSP0052_2 /ASSEMBLY_ACC=CAM_ASM_000194 /LENGTH=32 /DNA_ID= /DNA_START= /DNA_END= /DNA_ORIENTATION=